MAAHSQRHEKNKNSWQIQEAKTHFSKLIHRAESHGLQKITRQGHEVAIVISKTEWDKLVQPKTSLIDFFTSSPLSEIDINIERSKDLMREVDL